MYNAIIMKFHLYQRVFRDNFEIALLVLLFSSGIFLDIFKLKRIITTRKVCTKTVPVSEVYRTLHYTFSPFSMFRFDEYA